MIAAEVHRIPERAARTRTLRFRLPSHPIATIFLIAVSAFVVAPLVSLALIAAQGDSELWPHLAAHVLPVATVNTLLLLAGVALISVVAGVGTAWIVTAYQFPGRNAFVWLLPLPLAFPTYIVAYVYADLLGGLGPVQSVLRAAFGWRSAADYWFPSIRSLGGAIFVMGIVLYPYVYLATRAMFQTQSAALIEMARMLGASKWRLARDITLPLARPAIAAGLALALLLPLLTPLTATLTTLLVLVSVLATNVMVFQHGDLVLPLASGLVLILVLFTLNMMYGFFIEARGMRQITGLFGQYVPPELVDEMARNPEKFNMTPRAQELSVLFSDVRGFTTISEALSPEDLAHYINEYLTSMSLVIREQHRGTLDKYIGDAIMAFWGAPVADAEHARNAVLAALGMQSEARALNEKFKAKGWPTFKIGIGVNSGVMRVGDMGSKIRKAYTVMGDAVNIASRLEGITKQYGADVIIGDGTRKLITGFVLREVDRVRVKGKDQPVTIYEPWGLEGQVDQAKLDEINIWNQSLKLYRSQDWDRAELQLLNLQKRVPNAVLYGVFIERIAHFRAHPPEPGWNGAWIFETK